jgi:hypothetical protein
VFVEVLGEAELLTERVARREKFRLLMLAFTNRPRGRRDLAHLVRGKDYCSAVVGDENIASIDHQVAHARRGEGMGSLSGAVRGPDGKAPTGGPSAGPTRSCPGPALAR